MNIVYLITGSGGSFYCGNCYRDMLYIKAIRKVPGIKASAIPLYLPPDTSGFDAGFETGFDKNVFFGAISLYLREKVPFLRKMPAALDKIVNSAPMLRIAARQAGTTRTEGLENLTLNMIKGDNPLREHEVDRMVNYLLKDSKPDCIHLSNALIIGLARQLKSRLNCKIICSLQNEDDWINEMVEPFQSMAWKMIGEESLNVDAFVSPSQYYKDLFISKTGVIGDNIWVVPSGIESPVVPATRNSDHEPALGYYCRINDMNGFDKLVDAFIDIKLLDRIHGLSLHVSGGFTSDDQPFINKQLKKIHKSGLKDHVRIYDEFQGPTKEEFFSNIDAMSVPVRKYDAYGLYILEANAAGVPVIQPATGAFPEILEKTGGGILYSPDNKGELAAGIIKLFENKKLMQDLGETGRNNVRKKLTLEEMSVGLAKMYEAVLPHSST
jgi:glycosyltransferase involved in cell wall biosynthesis